MMRIRNGLLLLTGLAVLAVGYRYTPDIARFFIFRDTNRRTATNLPATSQAQKIVRDSLPAAGLTEASLLSETWEDRTDPHGSWVVYRGAWRLPDGQPPEEVARRLKALVLGAVPQSEVYSVESDNGDLEIRIYHQSRLAALLRLEPTLLEWPPFSASTPPLLAIVLFGVDEAPQAVHELLSKPYPLAFALSPYSPFTLRVARDAVLAHKEVLVLADEDQPPSDLLQIVPHASGIVFINNPGGDPVEQARHIAAEGLYVLDLIPGGMTATWIRALRDADVPFIKGQQYDQDDNQLAIRRLRHGAAQNGAATLSILVSDAQQGPSSTRSNYPPNAVIGWPSWPKSPSAWTRCSDPRRPPAADYSSYTRKCHGSPLPSSGR